jgi:hypothetical protein
MDTWAAVIVPSGGLHFVCLQVELSVSSCMFHMYSKTLKVLPSPEVLVLTASSMHSDSVILSCVIWTLLSPWSFYNGYCNGPSLSLLGSEETPENTEREPDNPEPPAEGDVQMEHSSDYLYSPNTRVIQKVKIQKQ